MENLIISILPDILSSLLIFIAGVSCSISAKLLKSRQAEREAICSLLRHEIVRTHNTSMCRGYILATDRESIDLMSDAYFKLGGNGMVHHLLKDIDKLQINSTKITDDNQ